MSELLCPICGKDRMHFIGELPSCTHSVHEIIDYANLQHDMVHEQDLLYMKAYSNYHEWKEELEQLRVENLSLRANLNIAIEGLEEIYNTHEHIPNKYAQGAAKIASKTLGRLK